MNIILLLSSLLWFNNAWAYLDPGTGSLMIQSIIACVAGALFVMKTYWYKLKRIFLPKRDNNQDYNTENSKGNLSDYNEYNRERKQE